MKILDGARDDTPFCAWLTRFTSGRIRYQGQVISIDEFQVRKEREAIFFPSEIMGVVSYR